MMDGGQAATSKIPRLRIGKLGSSLDIFTRCGSGLRLDWLFLLGIPICVKSAEEAANDEKRPVHVENIQGPASEHADDGNLTDGSGVERRQEAWLVPHPPEERRDSKRPDDDEGDCHDEACRLVALLVAMSDGHEPALVDERGGCFGEEHATAPHVGEGSVDGQDVDGAEHDDGVVG
jgi:hypothetical protein